MGGGQGFAIEQEGLGRRLLHVHDRPDLRGDLGLDVVALVEHERDAGLRIEAAAPADLPHDPEELEGVGCAHHQIVVGIEAGVEVEPAELARPEQHGHDELDVRSRRWCPVSMTTVAFGPRSMQWANAVPQSGTSIV